MSTKRAVAIIDANAPHRAEVSAALMSFYDVVAFGDGKEAIRIMAADPPALIIAGVRVEPSGTINFIKAVRAERSLHDVPVLHVIAEENYMTIAEAKGAGANGYIVKPYRRSELIRAISVQLNASIEHEWEALPDVQRNALKNSAGVFSSLADVMNSGEAVAFTSVKDSVQPLVQAIENNDFKTILDGVRNHDDYTYAHSMRVATMLSLLGHAAGFKNDEQLLLASGGLLHDVGKMQIPHHILNKPGKLDTGEFEIMKSHVPETIKYLKTAGDIPGAVFIIAEQHHEKLDGTGYPHGLKGTQLNELARMAAIVDVYSALTDRRVYKPPMASKDAMVIMTEQMSGNHLDPHFVKMFKGILADAKLLD